MKEIVNLIAKTQKLIKNSEYCSVKLHGVSCSRADLENIVFYAEKYQRNGNIYGLMNPCGATKEVFDKLKINLVD